MSNECSTTEEVPFLGLELFVSHDWEVMTQNTHHSHLLRRHFVSTFGHKLQTIGRILAFYVNDMATIADVVSRL